MAVFFYSYLEHNLILEIECLIRRNTIRIAFFSSPLILVETGGSKTIRGTMAGWLMTVVKNHAVHVLISGVMYHGLQSDTRFLTLLPSLLCTLGGNTKSAVDILPLTNNRFGSYLNSITCRTQRWWTSQRWIAQRDLRLWRSIPRLIYCPRKKSPCFKALLLGSLFGGTQPCIQNKT